MNDNSTGSHGAEPNGDASSITPGNPLARLTSLTRGPAPQPPTPVVAQPAPSTAPDAAEAPKASPIELPAGPVSSTTPQTPSEGTASASSPPTGATAASAAPEWAPTTKPSPSGPGATTIGRLEHVAADQIWASDGDFASWLAANLDALGETIDLTFSGGATVDGTPIVVARNATGGTTAILTERGESTDAGFGQLLRQMVASQAERAVWVCARPRNDHGASVSWLNRSIEGRFEVVRVEVVTIGGSAAAPTFELAVRPSRADDPGVEAGPTPNGAAPEPGRRADDWMPERETGG